MPFPCSVTYANRTGTTVLFYVYGQMQGSLFSVLINSSSNNLLNFTTKDNKALAFSTLNPLSASRCLSFSLATSNVREIGCDAHVQNSEHYLLLDQNNLYKNKSSVYDIGEIALFFKAQCNFSRLTSV